MAAVPVTAQLVGHAFVNQYYNVLHHWPHMVHRFYTNASRLMRAQAGPDGAVLCASSQPEIHKTFLSMGYEHCKAEIMTVDSSESMGGSVLVLVTGVMHMHRFNHRRNFVQTFLLAPQEKGYYVLNDTLRYLEEDSQTVMQVHKVANGTFDMLERLQIGIAEADGIGRSIPLTENINQSVVSEGPFKVITEHNHTNSLKANQAGDENRGSHQMRDVITTERLGPSEQLSEVEELRTFDDGLGDRKSYASIVRVRDVPQPTTSSVAHQQVNDWSSFSHQQSSASHSLPAFHRDDKASSNNGSSSPVEVKGVYIKNLPVNVTLSQVEDDLVRVGCSRPSSVILKNHKDGGVYAFVDFEDSESALGAIDASPVVIGGKRAYIEERKSTFIPGRGRGRGIGRGASSSDVARSNGSHMLGTSTRGGLHGDGDASNQGRGARPVRGGSGGWNTRA